jgi:acyl transferase domain-containing protein
VTISILKFLAVLPKTPKREWTQHTAGTLERRMPSPAAFINIDEELTHFTLPVDIDELSAWFEARGLEYLPRFEGIEAIFMKNRESNDKFGTAMARIKAAS